MKKLSASEYSRKTFIEMMKDVATSTVGHILAFDPSTQLAQVQIGILRKDINGVTFEPAPIVEVPVYFAGGSEWFVEHQIDPLDEGVVMFSQRCIDGWVTNGGVATNPIDRFHDFQDAMFLPGMRSQPNKINDFQNDGIRLRNKSGTSYIWLKSDGVEIVSPSLTHNGVNIGDTHTHAYTWTDPAGSGNTEVPQ